MLDQGVRIFSCWHLGNSHNQVILEQRVERTLGGFLASCVGVEAKHNFVYKAFQDPRLIFRERCPLRRDHVRDSRLKQTYQIELSLADNGAVRLDQGALGPVQTKEHVAFSKKRRLR